jgi:hypothetical protein
MITRQWKRRIATLFGLLLFIPVAQAQQAFDFTKCDSGTRTVLSAEKELTITSSDVKGITMSHLPDKLFDNMTSHWISSVKVVAGQLTALTYTKLMDPDGDFVMLETTMAPGETEGTFKFLEGTGKWKGIKGGGKAKALTRGNPIAPGTVQGCNRWTGTFELPK